MGRIRLGETHTKADGFLHIKESTACTAFIFKRWFNTDTEKSQDPGYQAVNQNEEHHVWTPVHDKSWVLSTLLKGYPAELTTAKILLQHNHNNFEV